MKKTVWVFSFLVALLLLASIASAAPACFSAAPESEEQGFPNMPIFSILKQDKGQEPIEKAVFIHYKKGFAKPNPGLGGKATAANCYKFLGAKWRKTPVSYFIDPKNNYNLSPIFITSAIFKAAGEWDFHTKTKLFKDQYTIINDGSWDSDEPDRRNELLFGDYPQAGVIAVTVIWGYFSGPNKQIVEFDILFDTDFTWGNALENPAVMDLQNIATHEIGHGIGLADLYSTSCSLETMYGYSNYGDMEKRTLASGDIKGLQSLYGS